MPSRTTEKLVENAVRGVESAGHKIGSVEVHNGGFVRVFIADDKIKTKKSEGISCDEVFGMGSA